VRLDEISTKKLADYKSAAGKDASAADKSGNTERANKRFSGIVKATNKQFNNEIKKAYGVKENDDGSAFADEIYNALEDQYPDLLEKASQHAIGNAIMSVMHYEGQVSTDALVHEVATSIRQSLRTAEY
jgi:hypothetical protein